MSVPLVYIDQNIISLYLQGSINLAKRDDLKWIYSKEHFSEIRRANEPDKYLGALDNIGAQMLDVVINEKWMQTGEVELISDLSPFELYDKYIKASSEVDFNESIINSFLAWLNGGAEVDTPKKLSENLLEETLKLISTLPFDTSGMLVALQESKELYDSKVGGLIENGNDIIKTRAAFGDEKGMIGGISGDEQIKQIWKIISPKMNGISCDQFFGFDPIDKLGYELWPTYLGIISCNSVFDILGFNSEKKCRNVDKIDNVRSDAGHIANASCCMSILSADKRLVNRAKAIYEYKNIGTSVVLIPCIAR